MSKADAMQNRNCLISFVAYSHGMNYEALRGCCLGHPIATNFAEKTALQSANF